jgi:hypothetical protein
MTEISIYEYALIINLEFFTRVMLVIKCVSHLSLVLMLFRIMKTLSAVHSINNNPQIKHKIHWLFRPENVGGTFLRNIGTCLPNYTVSHPRQPSSSYIVPFSSKRRQYMSISYANSCALYCEKRLLVSSHLRPSDRMNNSAPNGWILMQFGIW